MKVIKILFVLLMILFISCEKDKDSLYLTHKLSLKVEEVSEYYIYFSWNDINMSNTVSYLLVDSDKEKDAEFYKIIVDYYINSNYDYETPSWYYECDVREYSSESLEGTAFRYYGSSRRFYKLIAFNTIGDYVLSNTINI